MKYEVAYIKEALEQGDYDDALYDLAYLAILRRLEIEPNPETAHVFPSGMVDLSDDPVCRSKVVLGCAENFLKEIARTQPHFFVEKADEIRFDFTFRIG